MVGMVCEEDQVKLNVDTYRQVCDGYSEQGVDGLMDESRVKCRIC